MFTIPGTHMPEPGIYADKRRREPDYTELVESIGARRAAQSMRTYFDDQADLPQPNGPMARP